MIPIPGEDRLEADLADTEQRAMVAHKRWRARRKIRIRAWWCVGLGAAVGSGATALLLAAMRYLP